METQHDRQTVGAGSVRAVKLDRLAAALKQLPAHRQRKAMAMLMNGDETRLAKRLKEAIAASGATHYAIGKQAGIRPDLLDRFMRGERDLRLASASKIANVLGLDLVSAKLSQSATAAPAPARQTATTVAREMPVKRVLANRKEGFTFTKAVIVTHCAVLGRKETAVRAYRIGPVAPYAQYEKHVFIYFYEPKRRTFRFYGVSNDNRTFLTVEVAGRTVYDSRTEVPCDMQQWSETNDKWKLRGSRGASASKIENVLDLVSAKARKKQPR